ncbi:MAG: alpha/beta hydrolase-fold protein [Acidobacteriota bacterium]
MRAREWMVRGLVSSAVACSLLTGLLAAAQAPATGQPAGAGGPGRSGQEGAGPTVTAPADAVAVPQYPPLDKTGDFKIAPATTWADVPAMTTKPGITQGTVTMFTMNSEDTQMFPGVRGAYTRNVWVYVPAGYVPGTELPLMVDHDGRADAVIQSQLIVVLDNLIAEKRLPMMAGVFIANGGDFRPSERSLEYDTVSGKYAEFIEHEVLPLAEKNGNVRFTKDPDGRGVIGQSSGSAAALAMAWFHPEWYHRVISYSGTFVNIQNNEQYPRGAWAYHEALISRTPKKPIRIWLEVGSRDNGWNVAETTYRNWPLANNRMAEVLKARGYEYQYVWAENAGHVERGVERQTLEEAMEWAWKTYKAK